MSFLAAVAGTALNAGATALQNTGSYKKSKKLTHLNYSLAEDAAQNSYERQLDFWNKQNAYNTPENQRSLLEDANLNPALMYGSSASASTAGQLSSVPDAKGQAANYTPQKVSLDAIQGMALFSQIKKTQADTELTNAQADATRAQIPGYSLSQNKLREEILSLGIKNKYLDSNERWKHDKNIWDTQISQFDRDNAADQRSANVENDYFNKSTQLGLKSMDAKATSAVQAAREAGFSADMAETRENMFYAENLGKILKSYTGVTSDVIRTLFGFLPSGILGKVLQGFGK